MALTFCLGSEPPYRHGSGWNEQWLYSCVTPLDRANGERGDDGLTFALENGADRRSQPWRGLPGQCEW